MALSYKPAYVDCFCGEGGFVVLTCVVVQSLGVFARKCYTALQYLELCDVMESLGTVLY